MQLQILGVAIFYVFNSIGSQTAMMTVSKSSSEILELMIQILSGVSVFVSFILAFLIIYASRFLMKRRKKEFGVYMTLGMSKRKISLILFFETLFIGIISLTVGLLAGTVLSQFMSVVVADMFEADMTSNKTNDGFIVLPDSALKNSKKTFEFLVADYNGETEKIEEMVNDLINKDYYKNTNLTINTKIDIRASSVGLGAIVTFIGLYLGIIFLISCAAILALKELSEYSFHL